MRNTQDNANGTGRAPGGGPEARAGRQWVSANLKKADRGRGRAAPGGEHGSTNPNISDRGRAAPGGEHGSTNPNISDRGPAGRGNYSAQSGTGRATGNGTGNPSQNGGGRGQAAPGAEARAGRQWVSTNPNISDIGPAGRGNNPAQTGGSRATGNGANGGNNPGKPSPGNVEDRSSRFPSSSNPLPPSKSGYKMRRSRRLPSSSSGSSRPQSPTGSSSNRKGSDRLSASTPPNSFDRGASLDGGSMTLNPSGASRRKEVRRKRRNSNDFIKPTDVVRVKGSYDRILLVLVVILTLFGLVMDFSASYPYAFSRYGDSFHFVKRQALFAAAGFVILFVAMHFDYRWLRKVSLPVYLVTLGLLGAVLLYGIASGVAQRWIVVGDFTLQPSEIMKFSLVILLALYVARNQARITNYRNFWQSSLYGVFIPVLIIGLTCGLIAMEKHFSGTIIVFLIGMVVIFAGGARKSWFIGAGVTAAAAILALITFFPYARERIDMWLHPEAYDPQGKIWQTLQGLYAVGSGGLFGVGLGNSRQKFLYVSQPQNDFVFSIIAEELGFAGAILVIVLFMLLIWRGFVIALKAPDTFSSLVVIGLISKVAIQTILNIGVVTNTIPNTGISLPFFSYGGSALLMQLGEMGIILSISRYSYQRE